MKKRTGDILDSLESVLATERRHFTVNKHSQHPHPTHRRLPNSFLVPSLK